MIIHYRLAAIVAAAQASGPILSPDPKGYGDFIDAAIERGDFIDDLCEGADALTPYQFAAVLAAFACEFREGVIPQAMLNDGIAACGEGDTAFTRFACDVGEWYAPD